MINQRASFFIGRRIAIGQAATVVGFIAVAQFILQLSLLARGVEYLAASLVIDDTYYYLQTAWNTKVLGFVTFDGLHSTNGVQFLWFLIIFALALLVKTKMALLFATLVVTFLLNGLCYLVILKIGATLKRPSLALLMAGFWAVQSLPFRIYSMGMENSLHALVFWCLIWQATVFLMRLQNGVRLNFWTLTAVLILNAWTRLDSALLSVAVYIFCVGMLAYTYRDNLRLFWQKYMKVIAGTSLFAALGFFTQLGAFWLMGDSLLPVSALVKSSDAYRGLGAEAADKFVQALLLGMPSIVQGRLPDGIVILLSLFVVLIVAGVVLKRWNQSQDVTAFLHRLWVCLLIGELLYHTLVGVSGMQYTPYFIWYRSPSFIFWILTMALAGQFVLEETWKVAWLSNIRRLAPAGASLILFAVAIYLFARSLTFTSPLYVARYDAAVWIAENSQPDTIYAAWNTGQLAFFSDRTFINLDGVINSVDYYERILQGPVPLADYLLENNVEYLVDYHIYDSIPDFPVVRTFPVRDESIQEISIWQVAGHQFSVK